MHPLVFVMLIASGALAHYRSYDTRNLIERDEPETDDEGIEIVGCPVCESASSFIPNTEVCIKNDGGKSYKKCKYGTYINTKCGNRRDCLRGPGDRCTEKSVFDYYGERCAPGYYCHPTVRECTGVDYVVPSNLKWIINPNQRYHDRSALNPNYPIRAK